MLSPWPAVCVQPWLSPYRLRLLSLHLPQPRPRRRLQGGARPTTNLPRRLNLGIEAFAKCAFGSSSPMKLQQKKQHARRLVLSVAMCNSWLLTACADHAIGRARATLATLSTWTLLRRSVNTAPRVDSSRDRLNGVWPYGVLPALHLTSSPLVCARCVSINSLALVVATTVGPLWTFHRACSLAPRQVAECACASVAGAQLSLHITLICLARLVGMPTVTFAKIKI